MRIIINIFRYCRVKTCFGFNYIFNIFVNYFKSINNNMVQKLREGSITIPAWLFTMIIGLLLSTITVIATISSSYATTQERVLQQDNAMRECKVILDRKVDKEDMDKTLDRIYKTLDRIEEKLDNNKK